jgi:CRISPR-associated protein Cmr5
MSNTTLSQERSNFALQKLIDAQSKVNKDFGSYMAGLPSMVLTNGLAQAFAFIIQKEKSNIEREVVSWTIEWLATKGWVQENPETLKTDHRAFMQHLSQMDQSHYLACQRETLALWEWLKRYAKSDMFHIHKS